VIECEPVVKVDVVKVALPLLSVPVPRVVLPSLNVTVPVAAEGVTVAVNLTEAFKIDGFTDEVNTTADACFTVCVSVVDVLVL
jgi:hypothetical protein